MSQIVYQDECYKVQGAIFEVYKELGSGLLEGVYQECLERELYQQQIPYSSQQELQISYKGLVINHTYRPDFICCGKIIIEIKAVHELLSEHRAQLFNYLKISDMKVGLLVNFGHHPKVQIERFVH